MRLTPIDDLFSVVESLEGSSSVVASLSGTMERGDAVSLQIGTRTITYQITGDEGSLRPTTPAAVMAEVKKSGGIVRIIYGCRWSLN